MAISKKRGRPSQIDKHPERVAIELARMAGVSLDRIASRFGIGRDAVWRHMETLSDQYKAALISDVPREEIARRAAEESGLLLDHFKLVRNLAERQLIEAKACSDSMAVAKLTRAALDANDAVGKLTGEIQRLHNGITINNNVVSITEQPEFQTLTVGLIEIAGKYPDAKPDIVALIKRVREAPVMIEAEAAHAA